MGQYSDFNPWAGMVAGANMLSKTANDMENRRGDRIRNDAAELKLQQQQALSPMTQRAAEEDITAQFDQNALNRIKGYHEVARYINGDPVLAEEVGKRMGADPQQLLNIKPISPETSVYDAGDGNKIVATMGPDGKMKVTKLVDPAASFNLAGKSQLLGEKAGYDMDRVNAQIAGHLAGIQLGASLKSDAKPSLTTEQDEVLRGMLRDGKLTPKQLRGMKPEDKAMIANTAMDNPDYNPLKDEETSRLRGMGSMFKDYTAIKALPSVLKSLEEAGSALDFPTVEFAGKLQAFKDGQLNDPKFIRYMTFRNDAIIAIARAIRGGVPSDVTMKLEEEAMRPTMPPAALKAYVDAQMEVFKPRMEEFEKIYGKEETKSPAPQTTPAPAAQPNVVPTPVSVPTEGKETPLSSMNPGEQRAIRSHPKWAAAKPGEYVTLTNKARGTIRIKKEAE